MERKFDVLVIKTGVCFVLFFLLYCSEAFSCGTRSEQDKLKDIYGQHLLVVETYVLNETNDQFQNNNDDKYERVHRSTGVLASKNGTVLVDYKHTIDIRKFLKEKDTLEENNTQSDKYKIIVYKKQASHNEVINKTFSDETGVYEYINEDDLTNLLDKGIIYSGKPDKYNSQRELFSISISRNSISKMRLDAIHKLEFNFTSKEKTKSVKNKNYCTLGYNVKGQGVNSELYLVTQLSIDKAESGDYSLFELKNLTEDHSETQSGGIVLNQGQLVGILSTEKNHVIPIAYYDSFFPNIFISNLRGSLTKTEQFMREYLFSNNIEWKVELSEKPNCSLRFVANKKMDRPPYLKLVYLRVNGVMIRSGPRKKPTSMNELNYILTNKNPSIEGFEAGVFCLDVSKLNQIFKHKNNKKNKYTILNFSILPFMVWEAWKSEEDKASRWPSGFLSQVDKYNERNSVGVTEQDNTAEETISKYWPAGIYHKEIEFPTFKLSNNKLEVPKDMVTKNETN